MNRRRYAVSALFLAVGVLCGWWIIQQRSQPETSTQDETTAAPMTHQERAPHTHENAERERAPHTHENAERERAPHTHENAERERAPHTHENAERERAPHTHDAVSTEENEIPALHVIERPLDMTGDLGELYEAYREVQAEISRLKEGSGMAFSEIYALIDSYGFNSDWTLFLRTYSKQQIGLPLSSRETNYFDAADILYLTSAYEKRAQDEWEEVSQQTKPLKETLLWAKENAPLEYQHLYERYLVVARAAYDNDIFSTGRMDAYRSVEEEVNRGYDIFFTALSEMASDARVFEVFSKALAAHAQLPMSKGSGARTDTPLGSVNTADEARFAPVEAVVHEPASLTLERTDDPPTPPETTRTPDPTSVAEMEAKTLAAMDRYGVEEGLRQLAEAHPDWAERIVRWAEERHRRRRPDAPMTPPTPPKPYEDHDDNDEGRGR